MCEHHSEAMRELQERWRLSTPLLSPFSRTVTDSCELLQAMAAFQETRFELYLKAEAPVLRKNGPRWLSGFFSLVHGPTRSAQLREAGNKAYTGKKNPQALQLYTEAVRFAPYSGSGQGEQLCLAYANR